MALPPRVSSRLTEEASFELWHASELPGRQIRMCVTGFALAFLLQYVWDRALATFSIAAVLPMKPCGPSKNRNILGQKFMQGWHGRKYWCCQPREYILRTIELEK